MTDYRPLVNFAEACMPLIKAAWMESYKQGYEARMAGKKRMTHTRRGGNRGMWFKGWDDAAQALKADGSE